MASSTKMRLSSRRNSTQPPVDEDILASSSAGWKAVALPEPAKMVSLPDVADLPPVDEIKSERKSKKELKAERISAKQIAKEAVSVESSPIPAPKPKLDEVAPAPSVSAAPIVGAGRFAQKSKPTKPAKSQSSKTGLYALVGVGLAAAAGVGWYVSTQMGGDAKSEQVAMNDTADRGQLKVSSSAIAPAPGSAAPPATVTPIEAAPAEPKSEPVATGMAAAADENAADGEDRAKEKDKDRDSKASSRKGAKQGKKDEATPPPDTSVEVKKPDAPKDKKAGSGTGEEGEPSFDALLKEAGVPEGQKAKKVVLEKKSLTGADIKKGMGAVTAKAQACYAGTQGTAAVRLTVLPTGQIEKVKVSGVFAGTPVGTCVENAVKGATFPAWEGGPQTFGYSYLLAE